MKKKSRQLRNGYVMVYKHKERTAQIPTPLAPGEKQLKLVQTLASLKQLLLLFFG